MRWMLFGLHQRPCRIGENVCGVRFDPVIVDVVAVPTVSGAMVGSAVIRCTPPSLAAGSICVFVGEWESPVSVDGLPETLADRRG